MTKLSQIRMRDPFIVPYNNVYYLYGTVNEDKGDTSLYVYRSTDLENWSEPSIIFTIDPDFWAEKELWAPEVHRYNNKFYIFVSILGKNGLRGTQIAVSDTPDGIFIPVADRPATPLGQSCIDGTLYVEDGIPYIVYSHDWPDNYMEDKGYYLGEICAVELKKDLSEPVGEPFTLFTSLESKVSAAGPTKHSWFGKNIVRYGSDGPFINKMKDGSLLLTWSPIPAGNYVVLGAVSVSGKIRDKWTHLDEALFDKNGGHAMFFEDFNGQKKMCIHYPEKYPKERALILDVKEEEGRLKVKNIL